MTTDKVSIIVPTFDRETLLPETVRSVLAQSHQDWELLLIDDHSNDNTFSVAQDYASRDCRIHAWQRRSELKGAPTCRNEGITQSSGDYIIFLDSDDLIGANCLKSRLAIARQLSDKDFWVFPTEYFHSQPGDNKQIWHHPQQDLLNGFLRFPLWGISSPIWRKAALQSLGGFRESLRASQDWDLHVRALINKLNCYISPSVEHYAPDAFCRRDNTTRISNSSNNLLAAQSVHELLDDTLVSLRETGLDTPANLAAISQAYFQVAIRYCTANERHHAKVLIQEMANNRLLAGVKHMAAWPYVQMESSRRLRHPVLRLTLRRLLKLAFAPAMGDRLIRSPR